MARTLLKFAASTFAIFSVFLNFSVAAPPAPSEANTKLFYKPIVVESLPELVPQLVNSLQTPQNQDIEILILVGKWCPCLKHRLTPRLKELNLTNAETLLGRKIQIYLTVVEFEQLEFWAKYLKSAETGSPQAFIFRDGKLTSMAGSHLIVSMLKSVADVRNMAQFEALFTSGLAQAR